MAKQKMIPMMKVMNAKYSGPNIKQDKIPIKHGSFYQVIIDREMTDDGVSICVWVISNTVPHKVTVLEYDSCQKFWADWGSDCKKANELLFDIECNYDD